MKKFAIVRQARPTEENDMTRPMLKQSIPTLRIEEVEVVIGIRL